MNERLLHDVAVLSAAESQESAQRITALQTAVGGLTKALALDNKMNPQSVAGLFTLDAELAKSIALLVVVEAALLVQGGDWREVLADQIGRR